MVGFQIEFEICAKLANNEHSWGWSLSTKRKFLLRRRRSERETLRLGEKFLKNLGKRKIGLKVEWIFAQWSTNIGILEKEKEFKKKWFKMILRNEQWLKNFWEKGKFVVGRKLGRGNYGIHNVNFSIIFVAIWTQ